MKCSVGAKGFNPDLKNIILPYDKKREIKKHHVEHGGHGKKEKTSLQYLSCRDKEIVAPQFIAG